MNNLDGTDGPNLTNGPNGIPGIPDLSFFGFDFGQTAHCSAFDARPVRQLLLPAAGPDGPRHPGLLRLNNTRIGRAWVAIREDETAAEAMGVNVFRLKLFAFAGGAFLAGLAGTVKAHVRRR